jgi:hypothetical protein
MVDAETLRLLVSRTRAIASDCFDPAASQRLHVLSEELEKMNETGGRLVQQLAATADFKSTPANVLGQSN